MKKIWIALFSMICLLGGCKKVNFNVEKYLNENNPRVSIEMMDGGKMNLELFLDQAPITVNNFLKLIEENFYDGLIFHRVIKGFMIQGGDPTGTGMGGSDETIKGEFKINGVDNPISHIRGVLSMARSRNNDSASSQFFICHQDAPHLNGGYAAFGYLYEGSEVLDQIASVKTNRDDKPLTDIIIKTIKRVS